MTALCNIRKNTITKAMDWRDMDYEEKTCSEFAEVSGQFGIKVQDMIHSPSVGRKRVSGLVISSITRPGGNTSRFNFSGSPDLSTVVVGDFLHRKSCTSSANNGRDVITAVSDGSDYIEISDAGGVAQGGAAGECAVSYDEHDQCALDDEPIVGEFNADTRFGTGRIVLHEDEDTNIFIVQYQGGGSSNRVEDSVQIPDGSVTLAKLADLAESRMIGRAAGAGTGVPTALTPAQIWTLLGLIPKVVEIVDWDMDANADKSVAHGIADYKKIRMIDVIIRDDSDSAYYPLRSFLNSSSSYTVGGISEVTSTNIVLSRLGGQLFDTTFFDSTGGYVRGWITIWSVP